MKKLLKKIIKTTPLYAILQRRRLINWERSGRPIPPPHIVKQQLIRDFAEKFELKILIETGTYYGDMIEAMKAYFDQIYSIELSKELYERAKKRFDSEKNIKIIHGDSGVELKGLLGKIKEPALFWLDGHYSEWETTQGDKDTPIYEELTHILNTQQSRHVIIIDDARCFRKDTDYQSIETLKDFIRSKRPDANIEVKDDSIRITPSKVNG